MIKNILLALLILVGVGYSQEYPFPVGEFNATINYEGILETDFWLRATLNDRGQRIFDEPRVIYTPQVSVEQYGVGAGGWSYAVEWYSGVENSEVVFVGQDIGGVYRSDNGGDTWRVYMDGINDSDRLTDHYTRYFMSITTVKNSYFNGIFGSSIGGIFKSNVYGDTDWEPVTPNNPNLYYYHDPDRPLDPWARIDNISFSTVDWDEEVENIVVAVAGRRRYEVTGYLVEQCSIKRSDRGAFNYYPNYVKEDDETNNWGCPYGVSTLWIYDYTSDNPEFKPVNLSGQIVQNPNKLTDGNIGAGRYADITVVNGNKMVAVSTERGVFIYNLTDNTWMNNSGDMNMMSYPFYCSEYDFTSRYGESYTFSEDVYCEDVGRNYYRGEMLQPWAIHLTKHGELYAAFLRPSISANDWLYVSGGLYKFDINNPSGGWVMVEGQDARIYCSGGLCNGVELYRSLYDYCIYSEAKNIIYMAISEGELETDNDIVYLMDREYTLAGNCFRLEVNGGFDSTTIERIDNITPTEYLTTRGIGNPNASWRPGTRYWEYSGIVNPAINPSNNNEFIIQASYDLMRFNYNPLDGDNQTGNWEFIQCTSEFQDGIQYWKHTGFNEIATLGLRWLPDGRHIAFAGDNGLFWQRGTSEADKYWFQYSNPRYSHSMITYTDHVTFLPDVADVELVENWGGTTDTQLIAIYGRPLFPKPSRIMVASIVNGVAPEAESTDWFAISSLLPDELHHIFTDLTVVENGDNYDVYVLYKKYADEVYVDGTPNAHISSGVYKFTYTTSTSSWSYSTFNTGFSTYMHNGELVPSKILIDKIEYSENYNTLAIAADHNGYRYQVLSSGCEITMVSGGIYVNNLNNFDQQWVQIVGGHISDYSINTSTCVATQVISNNYTLFGDVKDLDWYNNRLYFSTYGSTGDGYGTVAYLEFPQIFPTNLTPQTIRSNSTLEILANDSADNIPFNYTYSYNPKDDNLSLLDLNRRSTLAPGVVVDQYTGDVYAVINGGNAAAFGSQTGLWKYSSNAWSKIDLGKYDGYANYGVSISSEFRQIGLHTLGADWRIYFMDAYTPTVYNCPAQTSDFVSLSFSPVFNDLQIDVDMTLPAGSSDSILEFRYVVFDGYSTPTSWETYIAPYGSSYDFTIDTNLLPSNINYGAPSTFGPVVVYSWKFHNQDYTSSCTYYGYTGALSPFAWSSTPYKIQIPRP